MRATFARVLASVLAVVGLVFTALYVAINAPAGTLGFSATVVRGAPAAQVTDVAPGGPADRAGIRVGDVVRAPRSAVDMLLLANAPLVADGDRVRFDVERGERRLAAEITAARDNGTPLFEGVLFAIVAIPLLLLGFIVVWTRPDNRDARTIGAILLLLGIFTAMPDRVGTPLVRFVGYEVLTSVVVVFAIFATAVFFARYSDDRGRSRAGTVVLVTAVVATVLSLSVVPWYFAPAIWGRVDFLDRLVYVTFVTPACAVTAFFLADRRAEQGRRMRLRFLATMFAIGYSGLVVLPPLSVALGPAFNVFDQAACIATLFPFAIGMTYGVLRRRVVDVAFVLNRAIVFSLVSALIVAGFILIETSAGSLLFNASRTTGFVVQVAIAVIIGLSLKPIHDRVDRIVDRTFFARRYAAERALKQLGTDVHFIRDRDRIVERVLREISQYIDVERVALYAREDVNEDFVLLDSYGEAPINLATDDDAVLRLIVDEAPLDLLGVATAIPGELAIPLAIRKSLVGVLALGHKRSGEAFAPDEIALLRLLGPQLAAAFLAGRSTTSADPTLREVAAELRLLRHELQGVVGTLRRLEDSAQIVGLPTAGPPP